MNASTTAERRGKRQVQITPCAGQHHHCREARQEAGPDHTMRRTARRKTVKIKKNKDNVKFKVRCSCFLYTLVILDREKAEKL
jgi:hypothetical protein